jgi:hypothetical protein
MKFFYSSILLLLTLSTSCKFEKNNDHDEKVVQEEKPESSEEKNDDVDFDFDLKQGELMPIGDLKSLFPKSMGRINRQSIKGESTGAFGFNLATVKSEFEEDDKEITLELIDFGGIPGIAQVIAAWSKSDLFHEDEDGFEKVAEWNGHKTFEKSDTKDNNSSIAILYKNRFLVSASARNISLDDLKDYLEDDFMDELDELKLK